MEASTGGEISFSCWPLAPELRRDAALLVLTAFRPSQNPKRSTIGIPIPRPTPSPTLVTVPVDSLVGAGESVAVLAGSNIALVILVVVARVLLVADAVLLEVDFAIDVLLLELTGAVMLK